MCSPRLADDKLDQPNGQKSISSAGQDTFSDYSMRAEVKNGQRRMYEHLRSGVSLSQTPLVGTKISQHNIESMRLGNEKANALRYCHP
jgi:hypothetical protein